MIEDPLSVQVNSLNRTLLYATWLLWVVRTIDISYEVITVILKNSQFSIINKHKKDVEYIKDVYKKRIQSEADSFISQEDQPDTILAQDILFVDRISI